MRLKTVYRCQNCGHSEPKWAGKCPECGAWNTFVEEAEAVAAKSGEKKRSSLTDFSEPPVKLSEAKAMKTDYIKTGISELDRALGGGIVPGQAILLAGPPGIGKSTLTIEACAALAAGPLKNGTVLYISGEESLGQVGSRASRLGIKSDNVFLMSETDLSKIISQFRKIKPSFLVLDSIQTVCHPEFTGSPGSVGQIRECASELLKAVKSAGVPMFLLGHVTKEGSLAGPKVLEHIVDTVLYFDAEKNNAYRVLRPHKNRFGPVEETGIFEMTSAGLKPVGDAGRLLGDCDRESSFIGRTFAIAFEGTRPILAEIQVLTARSYLPYPRRTVTGFDLNRSQMLIAALEKNLSLHFEEKDVFISIQGGIKFRETSLDLALCAALISSAKEMPLPPDWVFMGEVGVLAQVSAAPFADRRISEAGRLEFKHAFTHKPRGKAEISSKKLAVHAVKDLRELLDSMMRLKPCAASVKS